jgi:hypothetical protein
MGPGAPLYLFFWGDGGDSVFLFLGGEPTTGKKKYHFVFNRSRA